MPKIKGGRLILRLNPVEMLLAFSLRSPSVPLSAVVSVDVTRRPGALCDDIDFGFAGNTAPGRFLVTAFKKGRYRGGRAAAFVYLRLPSVVIHLDQSTPWRLFLCSSTHAQEVVEQLQAERTTAQSPDR